VKELRAAVKAALERMEAAHKALTEAPEDADLDVLTKEFDDAEAEHRTATEALVEGEKAEERTKRVAEARKAAPVEPVEPEIDPEETKVDPEERKAPEARVKREPLTYERGNGFSVFADLARVKVENDESAQARIHSHLKEMRIEKRAHPNQTAGEGGEFIAPIWMQDEWIKLPRAGRAVADSLNRKPFPGTNSVNLPKLATGSETAVQTDGGAVKSTDITTTSVTGAAQTIAGQQDVSMQLVDLSNPGMDEVLFDDLGRDYNQRVDILVINSSTSNAKGLLQLSGTNEVTFTQATPTVPLLYPKVANGIQKIHTGIFRPPSVIGMHPRRWAFILAGLDTQNRPLVTPYAGINAVGKVDGVVSEAIVGEIQGLPVIVDANIPTNEGAGTNQDSVLIYSARDLYLFEDDTPRLRVLSEVLSGNLQVRFQIYNYVILIAGRLPKAISKIQGTGLAEPTF
jgi:HK97 family phage major capsid protein